MGPNMVVLGSEVVEGTLLGADGRARRPGSSLEDEVHVLVTAVLLGRSGLDELRRDAELNEPDAES
jgi:hypothetical protein